MTTRVGVYERISQDPTGKQAGVKRQRTENLALVDRLGWQVVDTYVDNDTSAVNRRKVRREYRRLLDDMRGGKLDAVVAWHSDRLYRQPRELEELIDLVEQRRVLIRTVQAGEIDLSTPSGRLFARQLAAHAKFEGEHKAERWWLSVTTNRAAGEWSNARDRLFGYERDGVVNEPEAELLRWMGDQVLAGRSLVGIAQELNDEGHRTTRGNRWAPGAVRHLLLNPRIAGLATLRGEIVGQGQWQPILDRREWERVTAGLAPYRARPPRQAVLTGYVWCMGPLDDGVCGSKMHSGARARRGGLQRIYRCPSNPPYNVGCGRLTIAAEPVEQLAIGYAQAKLADPVFVQAVESRRNDGGHVAHARQAVDELETRHDELTNELGNVRGRTASAVVAALGKVEHDLGLARDQLARSFAPELPDLADGWPSDVEAQNALIGLTLHRVEILPSLTGGGRRFDPDRVRIVPVDA